MDNSSGIEVVPSALTSAAGGYDLREAINKIRETLPGLYLDDVSLEKIIKTRDYYASEILFYQDLPINEDGYNNFSMNQMYTNEVIEAVKEHLPTLQSQQIVDIFNAEQVYLRQKGLIDQNFAPFLTYRYMTPEEIATAQGRDLAAEERILGKIKLVVGILLVGGLLFLGYGLWQNDRSKIIDQNSLVITKSGSVQFERPKDWFEQQESNRLGYSNKSDFTDSNSSISIRNSDQLPLLNRDKFEDMDTMRANIFSSIPSVTTVLVIGNCGTTKPEIEKSFEQLDSNGERYYKAMLIMKCDAKGFNGRQLKSLTLHVIFLVDAKTSQMVELVNETSTYNRSKDTIDRMVSSVKLKP